MKIIGLIGNILVGIFAVIGTIDECVYHHMSPAEWGVFIPVMVLIVINVINHVKFYKSQESSNSSLNWFTAYLKRKAIEEQVKTLEAEKRVKELQAQ